MAKEKIWALYAKMCNNMWSDIQEDKIEFDEDFWRYIVDGAVKAGFNTIMLDVGDAVKFKSHPELAVEGSWEPEKMIAEVRRCRELGIELVPRINFSSAHNFWMKDWRRMTSSEPYYRFCRDVLKDIYEAFDGPSLIHFGYDEEVPLCCQHEGLEYSVMRAGKLLTHDFRFLVDEIKKLGATPWCAHDLLWEHTEDYLRDIDPKENVIQSPWYYLGLRKEHFTPIPQFNDDGTENEAYKKGIRYREEDPFMRNATDYWFGGEALKKLELGFKYMPMASNYISDHNIDDMLWYFKTNAPDEQIVGYFIANWNLRGRTVWENKEAYDKHFAAFAAAKKKYYGE